ncbi:hypothetical protein H920_13473 [Fukomys damarensis]|uniref:Uncharacterized protein n=1 Tax=Fukomys damarensis TaxID=885580 RepID=A0A091D2C5_FUKDA|nr:hypothetical protein H920_13473 [Fukomys damarensis]
MKGAWEIGPLSARPLRAPLGRRPQSRSVTWRALCARWFRACPPRGGCVRTRLRVQRLLRRPWLPDSGNQQSANCQQEECGCPVCTLDFHECERLERSGQVFLTAFLLEEEAWNLQALYQERRQQDSGDGCRSLQSKPLSKFVPEVSVFCAEEKGDESEQDQSCQEELEPGE